MTSRPIIPARSTSTRPVVTPSRSITPRIPVVIPSNVKASLGIRRITRDIGYLRILISGLSGQGKTSFIGTASYVLLDSNEPCNVLDISLDPDGEATIRSMGVAVDVIDTKGAKDHGSLIRILQQLSSTAYDQYDVVAIDPYNKLQEVEEPGIITKGVEDARKHQREHDTEIYELRDYNRLYARCRGVNQLLLGLKKHIIVTCISALKDHPLDINKKEDQRRKITSLALDGKMAHLLSADFSLHGNITKEGSGSNLKTITYLSQFMSEAKTRYRLPSSIENITFPMILKSLGMNTADYDNINWTVDSMGFQARER